MKFRLPVAFASTVLFLIGCAQDVGDINRVQPNFVAKVDFVGESPENDEVWEPPAWYIRTTVADVPPMGALAFVGLQLEMEKIRWEITESHLIAFRSHERFPGLNPMVDHSGKEIGITPQVPGTDDGHYTDAYKDAPVAAYPIISHFDIQRQYNTATGEQTNVIVENTSDRPWYERKYMRVNWSVNSIDHLTGSLGTRASWLDFAQYIPEDVGGDWAFRMETKDNDGNWVPHVVDPTRPDYNEDKRAGYIDFTSRLYVAAPMINVGGRVLPACYLIAGTYDCTSAEIKVRTSMLKAPGPDERTFHPRVYDDHDMMKFGYFRTERKIINRYEGETDSGMLRFANIHDVWETSYDKDGNVLPYDRRTPKPIYYALSPGYPEDLIPAAEDIARDWSRALTRAVAGAQGKEPEEIMSMFPTDDGDGNYVNKGLYRLNYNRDGSARIGDLRHNFIYWVDQPQLRSPLGYGPSSPDPETGEIISGQAFVYGSAIDRYARSAMKVVDALRGEYTIDEITDGEDVRRFMERHLDGVDPRGSHIHGLGRCMHGHGMAGQELQNLPLENLLIENLDPDKKHRIEDILNAGLDNPLFTSRKERMNRLKDTPFEAMMINEEVRASLPTPELALSPLNEEVIEAARPYTTEALRKMSDEQLRLNWASRHSIWLAEFSDPSVFPIAMYVKRKMEEDGWSYEDAQNYIRSMIFASVMSHEIGHTMGLRHNFQGTFDSINYFDEYWDLRKENLIANVQTYGDIDRMSELTDTQLREGMRGYQYSSIMDYTGRWSNDAKGLGRYDEAAVMYAYGGVVEVFERTGTQFRNRYSQQYLSGAYRFEERGSTAYPHLLDSTHYTRIPFLLGDGDMDLGIERLRSRHVMPYESVKAMRDPDHPHHSMRWLEVPYMFCSDEQVGIHASCHRWLQGADAWEQTQFIIDSWKNYYWFSNFRRDRWGWQASSALSRSYSRFYYLPNFYQHWLWGVHIGRDIDETLQQVYMQNAAIEGLNFLGEVMATPSYGSYRFNTVENAYELYRYDNDPGASFFLPRGEGRRPFSTYDWQAGYYYYWYQMEAGHYWDFLAALLAITEGSATVLGVDTQADFQSYYIPYYLVFSEELDRLFNGVFMEDHRSFAPRLVNGQMIHRPMVDLFGIYEDDDDFINNQPVISPYHTSSFQFYTLIYGMIGFSSVLDLDFAEQARIFRVGTGQTLEVGEGFEVERFENPITGVVYGALHKNGARPGGAVQMIRKANNMKDRWQNGQVQDWELTRIVDWMEVQIGLSDMFGRAF